MGNNTENENTLTETEGPGGNGNDMDCMCRKGMRCVGGGTDRGNDAGMGVTGAES